MPDIIHLVDSLEYAGTNCFQHQLLRSLQASGCVETVELAYLERAVVANPRPIICCLRQRTLDVQLDRIRASLCDAPVVVYDQDPWHAFMDDSPWKGAYDRAHRSLNVRAFAVTTELWAGFIEQRGMPAAFVRMGVLPEYCSSSPTFDERSTPVGFVGSLHPHRRELFEQLEGLGVCANVQAGSSLPYPSYLSALSQLRVFLHSEDKPIVVDGMQMNLGDGLWVKDVEAAARGCFSLRNRGHGHEAYCGDIETALVYDSVEQIPSMLDSIATMDSGERQATIDRSVALVRARDEWKRTAELLTSLATG